MNKSPEEIIALILSDNPRQRALGLMLAGKHHLYASLDLCIEALKDTEDDVRSMAAWALDGLCSPASVPALVDAIQDRVFGVRSNAGWALVHLAQRMLPNMVVPDVADVMIDSENDDARHMAYLVLYHIGSEDAQEAIRLYWHK